MLAHVEVARLDLLLRLGNAARNHRAVDDFAGLQPHAFHHRANPIAREDAHQVVIEAQEELGLTRVALTTTTAAQLIVDATRFVALGAEHVEAA